VWASPQAHETAASLSVVALLAASGSAGSEAVGVAEVGAGVATAEQHGRVATIPLTTRVAADASDTDESGQSDWRWTDGGEARTGRTERHEQHEDAVESAERVPPVGRDRRERRVRVLPAHTRLTVGQSLVNLRVDWSSERTHMKTQRSARQRRCSRTRRDANTSNARRRALVGDPSASHDW
jgi:hypothetical protein